VRSPCTWTLFDAVSSSVRSFGVSSRSVAPRFSSRRDRLRVPGIGTIQDCCASNHARGTCRTVASLRSEVAEQSVNRGPDVVRLAAHARLLAVGVEGEPELGGDHDIVPDEFEGLADELSAFAPRDGRAEV
jgi:hypothetical protein